MPHNVHYRNAAEKTIAFWAAFLPEESRGAFTEALAKRIPDEDKPGEFYLSSDYDPQGPLLEALHEAGIECRGFFFSSRDVGFPDKTHTRIRRGVALVKRGYGAPDVPLADVT